MEQLVFVIHQADEGGYWAEAQDYPLFTQGETLDELERMIRDAVAAYFDDATSRPRAICWLFAPEGVAA
ncbi:type II toxin-antitoxin system HicB family antitoxin [bacterium]|nr:type II toxin-antitoxin system HicB family antitoxin [bacterium]